MAEVCLDDHRAGRLRVRTMLDHGTARDGHNAHLNSRLAPDAVDRLLEPFHRLGTDRTCRGDGLSLGLSIVRAIADAHAATIDVHAQGEGGLQLEVTFPAAGMSSLTEPVSASRAAVLRSTGPAPTVSEGAAHAQQ